MSIFFGRRLSGPPKVENSFEGEGKFTLAHLRHIHEKMTANKLVTSKNLKEMVEMIRVIAEMIVYGDTKSETLFDFFCEKNMLALFLEILWGKNCPGAVHIQILQTLGILCQSVKNDTSLYYLLSNNHMNEIINFPFNLEHDDTADQFVSFLKTLALRLDVKTVHFFFVLETGGYPLLTRAIGLLQYREPMVRVAAQAIILSVYHVQNKNSIECTMQPEMLGKMFKNFASVMTTHYNALFTLSIEHMGFSIALLKKSSIPYSPSTPTENELPPVDEYTGIRLEECLRGVLVNLEDWLFYLQDIFDLGNMQLRRHLITYLMAEFVYPILLNPLMKMAAYQTSGVFKRRVGSSVYMAPSPNPRHHSVSSSGSSSEEDEFSGCAHVVVSLMYIQMMLRCIPDCMMTRTLLVALFYPLDRKERKNMLLCLQQNINPGNSTGDKEVNLNIPEVVFSEGQIRISTANAEDLDMMQMLQSRVDNAEPDNDTEKKSSASITRSKNNAGASQQAAASNNGVSIDIQLDYFSDNRPNSNSIEYNDSEIDQESLNCKGRGSLKWLSGVNPKLNNVRLQLMEYLSGQNERFSLLTCLMLHACVDKWLAEGFNKVHHSKGEYEDGIYLFRSLHFWPSDGILGEPVTATATATDNPSSPPGRSFPGPPQEQVEERLDSFDEDGQIEKQPNDIDLPEHGAAFLDGDIMSLQKIELLNDASATLRNGATCEDDDVVSENLFDKSMDKQSVLESLFSILNNCENYPFTVIQVVCQTVYGILRLVRPAFDCSPSGSTNDSADAILRWCLEKIKEACSVAAKLFVDRFSDPRADNLLNLMQEEMRRTANCSWSRTIAKMSQDVLLLLTPSPAITLRMGLEHNMPISQVELSRKRIQVFLLLRALCIRSSLIVNDSAAVSSSDDLYKSIIDEELHPFSENGAIEPIAVAGECMSFQHCRVLVAKSLMARFSNPSPPRKSFSSPLAKASVIVGRKVVDILFIFDDSMLLIASPENYPVSMKAGVIRIVAPIVHTDVTVDSDNRNKLLLLVRSWDTMSFMTKVGADAESALESPQTPVSNRRPVNPAPVNSPAVLQGRPHSTLWQMSLEFESGEDCSSAASHIITRRQEERSSRIASLQTIARKWL